MAKMFYTLEETQSALGRSADEIAQLTREGRLREFRDGKKTMYRADQVDGLKATLGSGALVPVDMGPSDSGAPIGLADTGGMGGSGIGLSLADTGGGSGLQALPGSSGVGSGVGSGIGSSGGVGSGLHGSAISSGLGSGISSAGSGIMNLREDTNLSADLGLSGSQGGMPSPTRGAMGGSMGGFESSLENLPGSGIGTAGGSVAGGSVAGGSLSGTRSGFGTGAGGINVLGDDDASFDPMAQTAISSAPMTDLNLESVGSGSGLLDLTRESDDTSLGAEVLDEITPSGRGRAAAPSGSSVSKLTLDAPAGGVVRGTGPVVNYVEAADPVGSALGWMAAGAGLVLLFGIFALTCSVFDVSSSPLAWMDEKGFLVIVGVLLIAPVVGFIIGFLGSSRSTAR